jgi:hypothetical protein
MQATKEGEMEYMLLIYPPTTEEEAPEEDRQAMFARFAKYTESLRDAGALIASDPLQPTHTATTVSDRGGETVTTDGPFAETKEWLAGYYKIDVESIDEAIEWASQVPSVKAGGKVEVRPVMPVPASYPARS